MKTILKVVGALVALLVVGILVLAVSLPPSAFLPPDLPTKGPLELRASSTSGPAAAVDVVYDELGVPHVFGDTEMDLAYGLGFVQARDRLYQIDVLRHAANGRLTELFGEDLLESDKSLRMLTHNIDAQLAAMTPRDTEILERFVQGINDGAAHAGRSMEMFILRTEFKPFKPADVIAIIRLQSWGLAFDLHHELFRDQARSKLSEDDPRFAALMETVPSGGVPIVREQAHSGSKIASIEALRMRLNGSATPTELEPAPEASPEEEGVEHGSLFEPLRHALAQRVLPMLEELAEGGIGASNSWVVSGKHTKSGAPMLSNDPHLRHSFPSVFYMVHLEHPKFRAAGVSFPGLPAVLIGHTERLAWGFTTSYVDAQDLVRLDVTEDGDGYRVDGEIERFTLKEQVFRMGQDEGAETVTETWRVSRFGPVLTEGFKKRHPDYGQFALMWAAYDVTSHQKMLTAFWDLYRAESVADVDELVPHMSMTGQNLALAFKDGTIAYRLAGSVAVRASDATTHLPRDGSRSDAGWLGFLGAEFKPQLTNPEAGYIVSSNQRVVDDTWSSMRFVGGVSALYHRAKRIDERLQEFIAGDGIEVQDFLDLQLDHTSVEARKLAPILGKACPASVEGYSDEFATEFCEAIRDFDGVYSLENTSALPYTALLEELRYVILDELLDDEDLAKRHRNYQATVGAVERALIAVDAGEPAPFFEPLGLEKYMDLAAKRALSRVDETAGQRREDWRWADHHTLTPYHSLGDVPLIGSLFSREAQPLTGFGETVRAEDGIPSTHGSVLRMVAEMTDPPQVRMLIDAGNSGNSGSPHYDDQRDEWAAAEPFVLEYDRSKLEEKNAGLLRLLPAK